MTTNQVKEKWVPVLNFEDRYHVSSLGNVRKVLKNSCKKFLRLKPFLKAGHLRVYLLNSSRNKELKQVAQLMLESFNCEERPVGAYIQYADSDSLNCKHDNITYKIVEEQLDIPTTSPISPYVSRGSGKPNTILTEADVLKIREDWRIFNTGKLKYGEPAKYMKEQAVKYKCTQISIYGVINRLTWKWL